MSISEKFRAGSNPEEFPFNVHFEPAPHVPPPQEYWVFRNPSEDMCRMQRDDPGQVIIGGEFDNVDDFGCLVDLAFGVTAGSKCKILRYPEIDCIPKQELNSGDACMGKPSEFWLVRRSDKVHVYLNGEIVDNIIQAYAPLRPWSKVRLAINEKGIVETVGPVIDHRDP